LTALRMAKRLLSIWRNRLSYLGELLMPTDATACPPFKHLKRKESGALGRSLSSLSL
jgi:hypothetical protein